MIVMPPLSARPLAALAFVFAALIAPSCASAQRIVPAAGAPLMVVGNEVWQPGSAYTAGEGWLALACDSNGCALEPARLSVRSETWQGHYDDQPTNGQTLSLTRLEKNPRRPVAWLLPNAQRPWLHAGPVTTWGSIAGGFRRAEGIGTLELAVAAPAAAGPVRFVPILDRSKGSFTLQLRSGERRQRLGPLGECEHAVGTGYLLWAGDLDGDGRGDYLVTHVDAEGEVVLYLSGRAAPDALVGVEAVYEASPFGGECDGDGWLGEPGLIAGTGEQPAVTPLAYARESQD